MCQNEQRSKSIDYCPCYHLYENTKVSNVYLAKIWKAGFNHCKGTVHCGNVKHSIELALAHLKSNALFKHHPHC